MRHQWGGGASLEVCGSSFVGHRKLRNQDRFTMRELPSGHVCLAVWDGHGPMGHVAAHLGSVMVADAIGTGIAAGMDVDVAMAGALDKVHRAIVGLSESEDGRRDAAELEFGTTAVVAVLDFRRVTLANVGDSRCVVYERAPAYSRSLSSSTEVLEPDTSEPCGSATLAPTSPISPASPAPAPAPEPTPEPASAEAAAAAAQPADPSRWQVRLATIDHTPGSSAEEDARVRGCGGRIVAGRPDRAGNVHRIVSDHHSIRVTRSLGHRRLAQCGVDPSPDVYRVDPDARAETLVVLASDGLWQTMSPEAVAAMIDEHGASTPLESVCDSLIRASLRASIDRGAGDNTTVVVARISPRGGV